MNVKKKGFGGYWVQHIWFIILPLFIQTSGIMHTMFTDVWSDSTGTGPPDSDSGEEFLRLPEKLGPNASPGVSKVIIYFVSVPKWFMFVAYCDQIETLGHLIMLTQNIVSYVWFPVHRPDTVVRLIVILVSVNWKLSFGVFFFFLRRSQVKRQCFRPTVILININNFICDNIKIKTENLHTNFQTKMIS
jgi:hypothetical protein